MPLLYATPRQPYNPNRAAMTLDPETGAASHQRQVRGLVLPSPSAPDLRRLKRDHRPAAQGFKVWNATWVLLDYLERHPLPTAPAVIDAGCGWGLLGIWLARHRQASVLSADIDPAVFPFVDLHARLNKVALTQAQAGFDELPATLLKDFDVLLVADACFRDDLVRPLFGLLQRARTCGVPRIAVADPGRAPFGQLSHLARTHLEAQQITWATAEPRIEWSGKTPRLEAHLLLIGDFEP